MAYFYIDIYDVLSYNAKKEVQSMDNGTAKFAVKWGVSQDTVRKWCRQGKIPGATQDKPRSPWHIPADAQKPIKHK